MSGIFGSETLPMTEDKDDDDSGGGGKGGTDPSGGKKNVSQRGKHVHVTDSFVQKVLPQELLQCNMIQNVMLSFLRWLSKLGMFAIKLSLLQQ
jgi:hypothetical protein